PALGIQKSEAGTGNYGYHATNGPDGWIEWVHNFLILLFECKNDIGPSGDPVVQVTLDYANAVRTMTQREAMDSQFPCLLVTLNGTLVTVHVAATIDVVTTEPVFAGFMFQGTSDADFTMAAHFIAALRRCIELMKTYYHDPLERSPALPYIGECMVYGE